MTVPSLDLQILSYALLISHYNKNNCYWRDIVTSVHKLTFTNADKTFLPGQKPC